jgi:poly-beta-1,6-N-acetyl-D-glucosamine synthase
MMTVALKTPHAQAQRGLDPAREHAKRSSVLRYVIVTPARNEEDYIGLTLESMVQQTVRPLKWVIVSDGSTDRTDEIVAGYARQHDWIELLRMPVRESRDFSGKVASFNAGYARVKELTFDIVGCMDADLSFAPGYFEFLLEKFEANPRLGVGGTPFSEGGEVYDYRYSSIEHVSGACQMFRRECYEQIGGYVPMKGGGIDVVAVQTAKLKGWQTRTFPEMMLIHHRPMSSANHRDVINARFKLGQRAYVVGWSPLWQIFRSAYQMTKKPYIIGGIALFVGYFWAMLRRRERPISQELIAFQRREQMQRLRAFFRLGGTQPASTPHPTP